jgi:hypothetical protein
MRNDHYAIRFGAELLPAMLRAIAVQRNCALVGDPRLHAALDAQYAELASQCGAPNLRHAVDDAAWFVACSAIARAGTYHWHVERSELRSTDRVTLVVDGRQHALGRGLSSGTENLDAILELMERHAAPDAVRTGTVTDWRPYAPPAAPAEAPAMGR